MAFIIWYLSSSESRPKENYHSYGVLCHNGENWPIINSMKDIHVRKIIVIEYECNQSEWIAIICKYIPMQQFILLTTQFDTACIGCYVLFL